ncbi:nitrogenase iron-molybdenum cofactor biosynthesis protein NifN [Nostoc sp. 'Peltigera membranacea cyanobiont' 213]|uniref:nitrogenase iron-molybdenum cofactor biosynthesis protein NifN n=1 Tax=Nostoc cyanobionts TaxID=3123326 RepID=UPI000B95C592|nr:MULTISPECIES: nitrogenase iron-molybdenum cofactor biosynthesis protein NifN [unclassified Nostoc]AVH62031.1 nitrogenase molybdenum-iron cofactor biosynthesis protein NifN [Nostoc sp. 'Peltigera membranacea cyanobiont' N6]OYD99481.1 nitrogenase iron-molybdenum cofactor biosynthesis protein NifN [Nostoc sp. 'Peltigera membranacea cyanobiont' 213]
MAIVTTSNKALTVNPLKQSQALGATLAFLGLKGTMPLFHGSQGCTAFAKVVLVRHFREAIPLATTAMTEVTTILGGEENVEQAILTLVEKANPEIIGLCSTGLTETRGDDIEGFLKEIRDRHPELNDLAIVFAPTPDFKGALQDGFAVAVESIVKEIPRAGGLRTEQVTILAGSAFTPGDVQEIKEMVTSFGLVPIFVPDLGASLDGHLEDSYSAVTVSGTTLKQLREVGSSAFTLALGESMRGAAKILEERFGTPYEVFSELTGLEPVDEFIQALAILSGNSVPEKYRRQRRQLQDAMLDTHFYFGAKRVSLALEPDLLWSTVHFLQSMGAQIHAVVTTTRSHLLEKLPVKSITIGDLEDFESLAGGSDLLIGNSNVGAIAKQLSIPLYRLGLPIYDRLGNGQFTKVGYRGTMELLFGIGNLFLEAEEARVKQFQEFGIVSAEF